jgi:tRNA 2-thiouridine synthesizing protein A
MERVMAVTKLDLTGLKCPLPALMTRKAMTALAIGDQLEVHCTDPMAVIDIPALIQQNGDAVTSSARSDDVMIFIIEKRNAAIANDD